MTYTDAQHAFKCDLTGNCKMCISVAVSLGITACLLLQAGMALCTRIGPPHCKPGGVSAFLAIVCQVMADCTSVSSIRPLEQLQANAYPGSHVCYIM